MSNVNNNEAVRDCEQRQYLKPVWRINTGNGVPSDLGKWVLLDDDLILHSSQCFSFVKSRRMEYGECVVAYQTNRTKEAKRPIPENK